jgi:hypothetical protein
VIHRARRAALAALAAAAAACAPALHGAPPPGEVGAGTPAAPDRPAPELLAAARAAFGRRPDVASVREAERLYLGAARDDAAALDALYGVVQARIWLADHAGSDDDRRARSDAAMAAAEACAARSPQDARCDYALALALGVQARERPSTVKQGLAEMVRRLERAARVDPALDRAGPDRVLALVLTRAPGWPIGPGDPEAGLERARAAAKREPGYAPNQLALAEALAATGADPEAQAVLARGRALAERAVAAGDPDAPEWMRDAQKLARGERP